MSLNPHTIHALDQFSGLLREVAQALATYREELIAGGMDPAEAFALVQRMEERIWAEPFEVAEQMLKRLDGTDIDTVT